MKQRYLGLESSRGIAAMVVAVHNAAVFGAASPLGDNPLAVNGYLMVDFFFVISGFVIAHTYAERIRSGRDLCTFQWRRFLRLYPLHLAMLLFFVAVELLKFIAERRLGISDDAPAFSSNDLTAFVNNLFLTQALFEDTTTFNGPSWSISTEFYTYLLFGLLVLFVTHRRWRTLAAIAIVVVSAIIVFVFQAQEAHTGAAIFRCTFAFFIGVLMLEVHRGLARPLPGWLLPVTVLVALASVWYAPLIPVPIQSLLFGALVLALAGEHTGLTKSMLENRALVYLGAISYGIYMIHRGLWWIITQVLRFVSGRDMVQNEVGVLHFALSPATSTALILAALGLLIALAAASHRWFETRFTDRQGKPIGYTAQQLRSINSP